MKTCRNCNNILDDSFNVCPYCGTRADGENGGMQYAAPAQNVYQQPVGGMPVYTAAAVRNPNAGKKKMIIIISSVAALFFAVVAAVIVFTNIHKCELCEKTYFGSKHNISFLGVSKEVCKDCYDEFYNELYSVW